RRRHTRWPRDWSSDVCSSDLQNGNALRRVDHVTGVINTLAGNGTPGFSGDGSTAVSALLNSPNSLAVDGLNHLLILDFGNARIRSEERRVGKGCEGLWWC